MGPRLRKWRFPNWQPEYEAAIAETDIEKLTAKTVALEDAIFARCREIAGKFGYEVERDAIQLAIDNLREIQKTKLGFPSWEQYCQKVEVSLNRRPVALKAVRRFADAREQPD